jgi:1-phosphofructokinase
MLTIMIEDRAGQPEVHLHAGGQGFWLARMVSVLGVPAVLCGAFGGETGAVVRSLAEREEVILRAVPVSVDNVTYVHDRRSGRRDVIAQVQPTPMSRHDVDALYGAALAAGLAADVCVLGGPSGAAVLPDDFYRRLAQDLRANGKAVVADLSGEPLKAALAGGLDLLKVSDEELVADGCARSADDGDVIAAMRSLHAAGARVVVVSRADRPLLVLPPGRDLLSVSGPVVEPLDPRGGGDALTAGIVAGMVRGHDLPDALRLGVAAAALNVVRRGLATGRRQDIESLAARVDVGPVRRDEREPSPAVTR